MSSDPTSAMKMTGPSATTTTSGTSSSLRPASSSVEAADHHLKRASRPPNIMIQSHEPLPHGDHLPNGPYSAGPTVSSASVNGASSSYHSSSNGSTPIITPVPLFPFTGYSYHASLAHHPSLHTNPLHPYYSLLARHSAATSNVSSTNSPIASPIPQPPMSAPATMKELPKYWPIPGFNQDLPAYSYSAASAVAALSSLLHSQQSSQLSQSSSDDTLYPFHHMNPPASQSLSQIKHMENEIHPMNYKKQQIQPQAMTLPSQQLRQSPQQAYSIQTHARRDDTAAILYDSCHQQSQHQHHDQPVKRLPNYPQYYFKGSLIQLADGNIRRVEDMKTQDFISCVQSSDAKLESSKVLAIESCDNNNSVLITFEVGADKNPLTVESPFEHPFFVYEKGWSACCPDRCQQVYDLEVRKLLVGDRCISLNAPQF